MQKNLDNTIACGIALKTQILKAELEIEKIQSELDYLQQSEGLEKPLELERLHTDYKKLNERYVAVKKRMADNESAGRGMAKRNSGKESTKG